MRFLASIAFLMITSPVTTQASDACSAESHAPFYQLLGEWQVKDWMKGPHGNWVEQAGATWRFECLEAGIAIQDFYRSKDGRTVGTNLRVRNPETGHWDVLWTATDSPGLTRYRADWDPAGDRIVMNAVDDSAGPQRAIYHDIDRDSWSWRLEVPVNDGSGWREVYRIEARRRQ